MNDCRNFDMYVCKRDGKRIKFAIRDNEYTAHVLDDDQITILEDISDTELSYIVFDLAKTIAEKNEIIDKYEYKMGYMHIFSTEMDGNSLEDLNTEELFTYNDGIKREIAQKKKLMCELQKEIDELENEINILY